MRVEFTKSPVGTANTNRDGTGDLEHLITIVEEPGEFLDKVEVLSLGSNAATEAVLIGNNGNDRANPENNYLVGSISVSDTSGTVAIADTKTLQLSRWIPKGHRIYALVHATQSAGRQFVAYTDPSYQTQA